MGAVYSVCGSATVTLAADVLPRNKITEGISRFAFTISIGMAVGPYIGIQVQNHMSSKAAFWTIFAMTMAALLCVLFCKISYPKIKPKKFSIQETIYKPSFPFLFNMMFLMIPYGAVIAYSSILAQQEKLNSVLPYFYIVLVAGMMISKLSTQKLADDGKHRILVYLSLTVLTATMVSYVFLSTGIHLLLAGLFFGIGYGILQPLFQSFVTGTTPAPQRGVANATYLLSYDIGIGIGVFLMGFLQDSMGLSKGFALTAIAYLIGGIVYVVYVERYYQKMKHQFNVASGNVPLLSQYMKHDVYTLNANATVKEAVEYFSSRRISGAPVVSSDGKVIGFFSDGDMMRYLKLDENLPSAIGSSALFINCLWNSDSEFEKKLNAIMKLNILEIGTTHPITVSCDASLEDVLVILAKKGIKKLPVVNAGKITGVILRSDMMHYLLSRFLHKKSSQTNYMEISANAS